MALCLECKKWKDNGEPYCHECDPDGSYARELSVMSSDDRRKMDRAAKAAQLKEELAALEKESN
jgi:hypothetical protein